MWLTPHRRRGYRAGVDTDKRDAYLGLVLAGWVMAFCLPIGGLIACFLLSERRTGHAVGMGAVSVVLMLAAAWFYLETYA